MDIQAARRDGNVRPRLWLDRRDADRYRRFVYLQDLGSNVYALDLATGQMKWEYQVSAKIAEGGPNGVAVAGGVVYGTTMTTVFALSATTGKTIWVDQNLLNSGQGGFGIQPQVADGRVYLASSIGTGPERKTGSIRNCTEQGTIPPAASASCRNRVGPYRKPASPCSPGKPALPSRCGAMEKRKPSRISG